MRQNLSNVTLWMSLPPMLSQTFGGSTVWKEHDGRWSVFRWRITLKLLIQENSFSAERQPAKIRFQVNIWEHGSSAGCLSEKLVHLDSQIGSVSQIKPDWLTEWENMTCYSRYDAIRVGSIIAPRMASGQQPFWQHRLPWTKTCRIRCPETPFRPWMNWIVSRRRTEKMIQ